MKERFILTENYIKILEVVNRAMELPVTSHKIITVFGKYGLGKTIGFERIAAEKNAVLLRCVATWSPKSFLRELAYELGVDTGGNAHELLVRVIDELRKNPRPLIIDEVDLILTSKKADILETIRDIHDKAQKVVVVMVGMQASNAKLKRHEHYYDRVIEAVDLQQTSGVDIERFCELSEVKILPDLIDYFAVKYPRLRKLKSLIIELEKLAKLNKITECNLETFKELGVENVGQS